MNADGDDGFSSDDDEEGFENPMDDNDDDLDDVDRDDPEGHGGPGGNGGDSGHQGGSEEPGPDHGDDGHKGNGDSSDHHNQNGGDQKSNDEANDSEKAPENNNNNEDEVKKSQQCNNPTSIGEIPIDKENPLRCVECDEVFENHFGLKQHYQNDHLKLLHKCNVEGCNAGFPSKRSRDRHSSNLNLHRKLLSTTSGKEVEDIPNSFSVNALAAPHSSAGGGAATQNPTQQDLLARLYAEQQAMLFTQMNGGAGNGAPDFQKMAEFQKQMAAMMGMPGNPFGGMPTMGGPSRVPQADSAGGSASPTSTGSMPNSPELKVKPLGLLTMGMTS